MSTLTMTIDDPQPRTWANARAYADGLCIDTTTPEAEKLGTVRYFEATAADLLAPLVLAASYHPGPDLELCARWLADRDLIDQEVRPLLLRVVETATPGDLGSIDACSALNALFTRTVGDQRAIEATIATAQNAVRAETEARS